MTYKIIIGTTPTVTYKFSKISVSNITTAVLTIQKKCGRIAYKKTLESAVAGDDSLSWTLTQEDTLSIGTGTAYMMLNCVLADGTRTASSQREVQFMDNHITEVI